MNTARKIPTRSCVACRSASAKAGLIRVVRCVDGVVRMDPGGKLPGRGAYLCGAKECFALAVKANKLGRALKCEIPGEVKSELEKLIMRDNA